MEVVEDDDVETMITLYCSSRNLDPIELFAELADVEPVQNVIPLNQQYIVESPYTNVSSASADRQSFVHSGTNAYGDEGLNNDGGTNHQGEDFNDLNLGEVLDDIDEEGASDDGNAYASLLVFL
ncbi:hypothetical protein PVK06_043318 [Gossypium arboreum]|uniref:Uncharacterized protein n=1 Tax=Gossypium arboreum TaxID=29729 RepID=A0ABR0MN47_GOSAR|nr:hypothetical protein PVK06_043318 [Gossypium arboreum]